MTNHLTDEQRSKAGMALQKIKGCPACGGSHLSVEDLVIVPRYWNNTVYSGPDSIAMLQVICADCFVSPPRAT
jgi:hypothetical protein